MFSKCARVKDVLHQILEFVILQHSSIIQYSDNMREIVSRIPDVTQTLDLMHSIGMFISNLETVRVDWKPIFSREEEDNAAKINMFRDRKE